MVERSLNCELIPVDLYQSAIRPLLFSGLDADPERLHEQAMGVLGALQRSRQRFPVSPVIEAIARQCCFPCDRLSQRLWGLEFPNPVGLAAGFDKNAIAYDIWGKLGFGFAELGTVTQHPQAGNPRPRLFRFPRDRAVLNRMGFNNCGSEEFARRLADRVPGQSPPIGINLGKSKVTPLEAAAEDYAASFRRLRSYGDYFAVNVSSPNTPGLRSLQDADPLRRILDAIQTENRDRKPLLVKIAPDLSWDAIAGVIELARSFELAGIIATNTTIAREPLQTKIVRSTGKTVVEEAGGLSGAPLRERSTAIVRFIGEQTGGTLPIVGVGGIFTAEDVWEKMAAGASLVQVYTGWVYEGPLMLRRVLSGLSQHLSDRGWSSISQLVGSQEAIRK